MLPRKVLWIIIAMLAAMNLSCLLRKETASAEQLSSRYYQLFAIKDSKVSAINDLTERECFSDKEHLLNQGFTDVNCFVFDYGNHRGDDNKRRTKE